MHFCNPDPVNPAPVLPKPKPVTNAPIHPNLSLSGCPIPYPLHSQNPTQSCLQHPPSQLCMDRTISQLFTQTHKIPRAVFHNCQYHSCPVFRNSGTDTHRYLHPDSPHFCHSISPPYPFPISHPFYSEVHTTSDTSSSPHDMATIMVLPSHSILHIELFFGCIFKHSPCLPTLCNYKII